ncbi:MAG: twin-arginine translocation signal domain-containing protein [bacterium]|nr:twin-arginine translocation signal domain-containing protein [bacterium]
MSADTTVGIRGKLSRRDFLKAAGLSAAVVTAGLILPGYIEARRRTGEEEAVLVTEPITPVNPALQARFKTEILYQGDWLDITGRTALMEPYSGQGLPIGMEYGEVGGRKLALYVNGVVGRVEIDAERRPNIAIINPLLPKNKPVKILLGRGFNPVFIQVVDPSIMETGGATRFQYLPQETVGTTNDLTLNQIRAIIRSGDTVFRANLHTIPPEDQPVYNAYSASSVAIVRIGGKTAVLNELKSVPPF